MALLSPEIIHLAIIGVLPEHISLETLKIGIPADWKEQKKFLGIERCSFDCRGDMYLIGHLLVFKCLHTHCFDSTERFEPIIQSVNKRRYLGSSQWENLKYRQHTDPIKSDLRFSD